MDITNTCVRIIKQRLSGAKIIQKSEILSKSRKYD